MHSDSPSLPEKTPDVAQKTSDAPQSLDKLLLKKRVLYLGGEIDEKSTNTIVGRLIGFAIENSTKPIHMLFNSTGCDTASARAIYDVMHAILPPVHTYCIGAAVSFVPMLLAGGEKGKRFALPNSRIMIHQPSTLLMRGQASDIAIHAKEVTYLKTQFATLFARDTGKTLEEITSDTERNFFMSAEEAKAYGIVDQILTTLDFST